MSDRTETLLRLVAALNRGVLVTLRPGCRPHLSNVNHAYDPAARVVRISTVENRVKVRNLRRDPRATYHVTSAGFEAYTVVDGTAELSPVAADPYDQTVEELIRLYRVARGEHPDWDEYRDAMVADSRLVVRLRIEGVYGALSQR